MLKTFTVFNTNPAKQVSVSQATVQFAKVAANGVQIRSGDASAVINTVTESLAQVSGDLGLKSFTDIGGIDYGINPDAVISVKDAAQAGNVIIAFSGVTVTVPGTVASVTADLNA